MRSDHQLFSNSSQDLLMPLGCTVDTIQQIVPVLGRFFMRQWIINKFTSW